MVVFSFTGIISSPIDHWFESEFWDLPNTRIHDFLALKENLHLQEKLYATSNIFCSECGVDDRQAISSESVGVDDSIL